MYLRNSKYVNKTIEVTKKGQKNVITQNSSNQVDTKLDNIFANPSTRNDEMDTCNEKAIALDMRHDTMFVNLSKRNDEINTFNEKSISCTCLICSQQSNKMELEVDNEEELNNKMDTDYKTININETIGMKTEQEESSTCKSCLPNSNNASIPYTFNETTQQYQKVENTFANEINENEKNTNFCCEKCNCEFCCTKSTYETLCNEKCTCNFCCKEKRNIETELFDDKLCKENRNVTSSKNKFNETFETDFSKQNPNIVNEEFNDEMNKRSCDCYKCYSNEMKIKSEHIVKTVYTNKNLLNSDINGNKRNKEKTCACHDSVSKNIKSVGSKTLHDKFNENIDERYDNETIYDETKEIISKVCCCNICKSRQLDSNKNRDIRNENRSSVITSNRIIGDSKNTININRNSHNEHAVSSNLEESNVEESCSTKNRKRQLQSIMNESCDGDYAPLKNLKSCDCVPLKRLESCELSPLEKLKSCDKCVPSHGDIKDCVSCKKSKSSGSCVLLKKLKSCDCVPCKKLKSCADSVPLKSYDSCVPLNKLKSREDCGPLMKLKSCYSYETYNEGGDDDAKPFITGFYKLRYAGVNLIDLKYFIPKYGFNSNLNNDE